MLSRWEEFLSKVKGKSKAKVEKVKEHFPFHKFFENAPQPVFKGRNYEEDIDIAEGCFRHIKKIFQQLEVQYKNLKVIYTERIYCKMIISGK